MILPTSFRWQSLLALIAAVTLGACSKEEGPTVNFEIVTVADCVVPCQASFLNATINGETYIWDFGDGNGSTEESPTHTYTEAGVYQVELIAANEEGLDSKTETLIVNGAPGGGGGGGNETLDQGLLVYYPFDTGNALDASGNNH
ncbi:MAG: PKD domain-containing protein, partial [Bacteroidota bacterium]